MNLLAAFNEPLVIKQVSPDGSSFVFARKDGPAPWKGITVKDPLTKNILYEVRVLKCSSTSCLGQVVKNSSGMKMRTDEEYIHSYNETPVEIIEQEPIEKVKPVVSVPTKNNRSIYLSYGSPVGPGFKGGLYKIFDALSVGINYAKIASETQDVALDGHLVSASGSYRVYKFSPSVDLSLMAELGMTQSTLNFEGVSEDGPEVDESTYFAAVAGEGKLNLDRFSLGTKFGLSKTGFAETYEGSLNRFANPYGTILVFLEIGAYYRF